MSNHKQVIRRLQRDYLEMLPLNQLFQQHFCVSNSQWKALEFQQAVLQQVVNCSTALQFPPAKRYAQNFVRRYVQLLEQENLEIDEELLNVCMTDLTLSSKESPICYKTYHINNANDGEDTELEDSARNRVTIKLAQEFNLVGLTTWEAGFYLSEFILANEGLFRCQQCLELGAGVGVTAVVLARVIEAARSAAKVTTTDQTASGSLIATDYAPVILDNLKHNLEINGLSAIDKYTDDTDTKSNNNNNNNNNNNTNSDFAVEVHALDWMTATNESLSCFAHVQTFLAADALYDLELVTALVQVLRILFTQNPTRVAYVAQTIRNPNTYQFFLSSLEATGVIALKDITHSTSIPKLFQYNRSGNLVLLELKHK